MTTIVFICTGNTCRSPMAACLFNAMCRREGKDDLRAVSAGTDAASGMYASDGALHAMERRGLSIGEHRSQPVTEALLADSAMIIAMSRRHIDRLKARYPRLDVPMRAFQPPIPDPYGGSDEVYEQTAGALESQIAAIYHLLTVRH